MESSLSMLSSLKDDSPRPFVQPHYREAYRLAIYALLCGGQEAYWEYLRAEQVHSFLSEEEIRFILENAKPLVLDDGERGPEEVSPSTYFPTLSDEEVPDLELGWPEVCLQETETSISLLYHPPRKDTPTIKEVVRSQIQEARQVRTPDPRWAMRLVTMVTETKTTFISEILMKKSCINANYLTLII